VAEADNPEAPEGPAGEVPEAPETELAELETLEPEGEKAGTMTRSNELDPLRHEFFGESKTAIDNLVSAIEFSPDPEELAQEKEQAARSMAEHFEIQSPFASIFSALSEEELEPEPMEDLESLEKEGPEPDDSPETDAERLKFSFAGPQLSVPFLGALNSEIAFLAVEDEDEDTPAAPENVEAGEPETEQAAKTAEAGGTKTEQEDGGVVTERDGVIYVNKSVLSPDKETLKGLDKNFKNLIDSILNNS
jgi:hypothetical protein